VNHLLPVITSPANWRLAPLPETLSPSEITRLLEAFSPEGPSGFRAYAMVRCVVDLGLRASEVVGLDLDDIDWRAGTIRVAQNKSRRADVLPLAQATGSAIARYLRSERPRTANRRVFVRHVAPVDEPIGPGVVRRAIHEAYRRCGLAHTRVHVLRHTLAGRLLEGGGTLKEVADVLRHRALDTSLIYVKVDTDRLSAVALPWPGSAK
jgi:integrase